MAQMAVALAGFTGIVEASQRREGKSNTPREKLHIALIVAAASYVVVPGFVPSALSLLPLEPEEVWPKSIKILLGAHITSWIIFGYYSTMGRLVIKELHGLERTICIAFWPFGLAGVIAESGIALGYFTIYAAFVFECVLILFLVIGLYSFLSLLLNQK